MRWRKVAIGSLLAGMASLSARQTVMSADLNERIRAVIDAQKKDNDSGIDVVANVAYEVRVHKVIEPLVDGKRIWKRTVKGLEGWDSVLVRPWAKKKRQPNEPYYALIGTVDGNEPARLVEYDPESSAPALYIPRRSGRLHCYFNDWPSRYDNNQGKIQIALRPVPKIAPGK